MSFRYHGGESIIDVCVLSEIYKLCLASWEGYSSWNLWKEEGRTMTVAQYVLIMYKNNFVVLDIRLVQLCHTAQQQKKEQWMCLQWTIK